jgi:hypothetical protein
MAKILEILAKILLGSISLKRLLLWFEETKEPHSLIDSGVQVVPCCRKGLYA